MYTGRVQMRSPASVFYGVKRFGVPAVSETRAPREPHGAKAGVVINDCGAASNSGVYPVCMKQNKQIIAPDKSSRLHDPLERDPQIADARDRVVVPRDVNNVNPAVNCEITVAVQSRNRHSGARNVLRLKSIYVISPPSPHVFSYSLQKLYRALHTIPFFFNSGSTVVSRATYATCYFLAFTLILLHVCESYILI